MSSTMDASVRSKVPDVSTRSPGPKSALPDYVLPERAIWALEQLSPELAKQIYDALTGESKRAGVVSPKHRDDDSQEMTALSVLDAHRALQDYGVVAESIADMVTVQALDIIALRVADVIWEEVNLWRVLASLRLLYRYIYQKEIPAYMRHRITFYAGAARRNQWDRVRSPAECIAGAVAAASLADVMLVAGQELLARTRFRDAALLGVGAEISFRTQELHYCDIDMIRFVNKGGVEEAKLFMAAEYCKNRSGRIGVVRDPIALSLLRRLIGERKTGALFCTNEGERASEATIAGALRRTSLMTLGVPISPNLLRRGAASDEDDEVEMARRIGDKPGGARGGTTVRHYEKSRAHEGLALLREP
ncbi:MAG: hypothetical protein ACRYF2_02025 [Janthinobacterium lividum]